jgi:hypothetical protein
MFPRSHETEILFPWLWGCSESRAISESINDKKQAEALLGLATRLWPEAVLTIKRALKFPSDD